nr:hypothetical protein HAGR004_30370 [Bdellovibrio sp. HAGR004]
MLEQRVNNEDVVENYKFASPEGIEEAVRKGQLSQTIFAMGCFWGPDANFGGMSGVVQTRVGYAGASTLEPTYRDLKGHAEVVRVIFDKDLISYRDLLGNFESWFVPGKKQGQYRPILFVFDRDQKNVAEELVRALGNENSPEVVEAGEQKGYFWTAEDYHQKYRLRRNEKFVNLAKLDFGSRWDEHLYFTKLNADERKGLSLSQWLMKLPPEMQKAYRVG